MDKTVERSVDVEIENINALIAIGKNKEVKELIEEMLVYYKKDQPALEKIDFLLEEPISEKGKRIIGTINKKGIDYYKTKNFEKSIEYFYKAQKKYPRYIGLKLNFVQALISSIKENGQNNDHINKARSTFKVIERYVSPANSKYQRYKQLNMMFHQAVQEAEYKERIKVNQEKKNG
jgi:tetratricopeptide (TPR) repeat protein